MSRRRHALKLAFLTAALALVALCLVALACAPAAPGGQASGPVEPDATAEATATATSEAATSTSTTEPTAEAATEATSAPDATADMATTPTPTPKPTTAGTPTPSRTPRLNGNAYTILALSETAGASGARGASGTASGLRLPDEIYAGFGVRAAHKDDFVKFLRANGATITAMPYGGPVVFAVRARISPSLLGPATRHPAFVNGYTGGLYPKMAGLLDNVITRYTLGELTVRQAAEKINGRVYETAPDYVNVVINLANAGESDALRAFLKSNRAGADPKVAGEFQFIASVPVPVLPRLAQREDVDFIVPESVPIQQIWEPTPESSFKLDPERPSAQTTDRRGAQAHDAVVWGNAPYNIDGAGIRIGIIDNGFAGRPVIRAGPATGTGRRPNLPSIALRRKQPSENPAKTQASPPYRPRRCWGQCRV